MTSNQLTIGVTVEQLEASIHECMLHGAGNVMAANEHARGFTLIKPDDYPWFPSSEWPEDAVVSLDGNRVRIIAVYTFKPGNGVFSRLITGICKAKLVPTVIAPFSEMTDILKNWGWHTRIVGDTFEDRCDEWFPTRKWRELRSEYSDDTK